MKDNEIIKALENCCSYIPNCSICPYDNDFTVDECMGKLLQNALDLINRQKAEIEKKNTEIDRLSIYLDELVEQKLNKANSKAIRGFAERLTDRICENVNRSLDNPDGNNYYPIDVYNDIDNLVKEMTEG